MGLLFAFSTALFSWIIGYFISLYFFSYKYSTGIIPNKWREKTTNKSMFFFLIATPIIAPIVAGTAYRLGGIIEEGIIWGCYIEYFDIVLLLLVALAILGMSLLFLIALVTPKAFEFKNRINVLLFFLLHNIYIKMLALIIIKFLPILSGPLHGKGGSCL